MSSHRGRTFRLRAALVLAVVVALAALLRTAAPAAPVRSPTPAQIFPPDSRTPRTETTPTKLPSPSPPAAAVTTAKQQTTTRPQKKPSQETQLREADLDGFHDDFRSGENGADVLQPGDQREFDVTRRGFSHLFAESHGDAAAGTASWAAFSAASSPQKTSNMNGNPAPEKEEELKTASTSKYATAEKATPLTARPKVVVIMTGRMKPRVVAETAPLVRRTVLAPNSADLIAVVPSDDRLERSLRTLALRRAGNRTTRATFRSVMTSAARRVHDSAIEAWGRHVCASAILRPDALYRYMRGRRKRRRRENAIILTNGHPVLLQMRLAHLLALRHTTWRARSAREKESARSGKSTDRGSKSPHGLGDAKMSAGADAAQLYPASDYDRLEDGDAAKVPLWDVFIKMRPDLAPVGSALRITPASAMLFSPHPARPMAAASATTTLGSTARTIAQVTGNSLAPSKKLIGDEARTDAGEEEGNEETVHETARAAHAPTSRHVLERSLVDEKAAHPQGSSVRQGRHQRNTRQDQHLAAAHAGETAGRLQAEELNETRRAASAKANATAATEKAQQALVDAVEGPGKYAVVLEGCDFPGGYAVGVSAAELGFHTGEEDEDHHEVESTKVGKRDGGSPEKSEVAKNTNQVQEKHGAAAKHRAHHAGHTTNLGTLRDRQKSDLRSQKNRHGRPGGAPSRVGSAGLVKEGSIVVAPHHTIFRPRFLRFRRVYFSDHSLIATAADFAAFVSVSDELRAGTAPPEVATAQLQEQLWAAWIRHRFGPDGRAIERRARAAIAEQEGRQLPEKPPPAPPLEITILPWHNLLRRPPEGTPRCDDRTNAVSSVLGHVTGATSAGAAAQAAQMAWFVADTSTSSSANQRSDKKKSSMQHEAGQHAQQGLHAAGARHHAVSSERSTDAALGIDRATQQWLRTALATIRAFTSNAIAAHPKTAAASTGHHARPSVPVAGTARETAPGGEAAGAVVDDHAADVTSRRSAVGFPFDEFSQSQLRHVPGTELGDHGALIAALDMRSLKLSRCPCAFSGEARDRQCERRQGGLVALHWLSLPVRSGREPPGVGCPVAEAVEAIAPPGTKDP